MEPDWRDRASTGEFIVRHALDEDGATADSATASLGPLGYSRHACSFTAREDLVLAGWFLVEEVFRRLVQIMDEDPCRIEKFMDDGAAVGSGETLGSLEGPAHIILRGERTALNLLGRLSGIATLTGRFVEAVEGTGVEILDTRKTTPCLRALEKYAVRMGGGVNHRFDLRQMAMIKDNHLAVAGGAGSLGDIVAALKEKEVPVEVEVDSIRQLREVLLMEPDRVLLDNMGVSLLRQAVEISSGSGVYLEASGGITLENVRLVAETGVDGISSGALTHSASSADIGLDWGIR